MYVFALNVELFACYLSTNGVIYRKEKNCLFANVQQQ